MFSRQQKTELEKLQHAMQSGVKFDIETSGESNSGSNPKHLRVGVNSAMVEHAALVTLLIQKGLITEYEYAEELIDCMKAEVDRYTKLLEERLGRKVVLA